jgi:hypothetical protein
LLFFLRRFHESIMIAARSDNSQVADLPAVRSRFDLPRVRSRKRDGGISL